MKVLYAAGETGEANQIRTELAHLLAEPTKEVYAKERAEFAALLPVIRTLR